MKLFVLEANEVVGLEECLLTNIDKRVTCAECISAEAVVLVLKKEELLKRFNNSRLRDTLFAIAKSKIHFIT